MDELAGPQTANFQRYTGELLKEHEGHTVLSVIPTVDLMLQQRIIAYFFARRVLDRVAFTPGFKYKRTLSAPPEAWMHSCPVYQKNRVYLQTKNFGPEANVETIHACLRNLIYQARWTGVLREVVVWDTDEGIAQAA